MTEFAAQLKSFPNFYALQGASVDEIERAERTLGTHFADDYRDYAMTYGVASFAGHELTGVCKPKRLNVVEVTAEQLKSNPYVPRDWYVVEEAHIDGIVIWQTPKGEIYQTVAIAPGQRINNSLIEYVSSIHF